MTPAKKLARLADLIGEAGKNYFERITLIRELLEDKTWIDESFAGDDYEAAQSLEDDYLHDLAGSLSIFDLLNIHRHFPKAEQWAKHKWNLKKLFEAMAPAPAPKAERTVIKKKDFDEVVQRKEELESAVRQVKRDLNARDRTVSDLTDRVKELEEENARLTGRIEELEHLLEKHFSRK